MRKLVPLLALVAMDVHADYEATGPIEGQVCRGFVIESCRMVRIDAAGPDGDELYSIATRYPEVSDYNAGQGRCWIQTKSRGLGLLSRALNVFTGVDFYTRTDAGEYEKVDVEYLTFPCTER